LKKRKSSSKAKLFFEKNTSFFKIPADYSDLLMKQTRFFHLKNRVFNAVESTKRVSLKNSLYRAKEFMEMELF